MPPQLKKIKDIFNLRRDHVKIFVKKSTRWIFTWFTRTRSKKLAINIEYGLKWDWKTQFDANKHPLSQHCINLHATFLVKKYQHVDKELALVFFCIFMSCEFKLLKALKKCSSNPNWMLTRKPQWQNSPNKCVFSQFYLKIDKLG